ncbi:DUF7507 domain-containing protein, partial [Actibacterium lipolyticum]|uniref:DUF7507 domain-containing protein n=1 Tax=Actibacterium lipolyticum TaxID=1524263 RepID=UPI001A9A550C
GNVTLALDTIAPITPTLTDADGTALTLTTAPAFEGPASSLGSAEGTLLPGEVATYTATYTLTQSDIDAGGLSQTATVDGTDPNATVVTATSDDPADLTGAADATVTPLAPAPAVSMELVDDTTALSTPVAEGDVVTYTYTVTNDGNVTLALDTIAPITPTLTDADGTALTLTTAPAFEGPASSLGSAEGTLLPGEVATYTATYTLTQSDIDAGGLSQTATVDGTDPNATVVTATSDDPADLTGAADATVTPLAPAPAVSMELVDDTSALSTPVAEGDVVTYTYTVTNDG